MLKKIKSLQYPTQLTMLQNCFYVPRDNFQIIEQCRYVISKQGRIWWNDSFMSKNIVSHAPL